METLTPSVSAENTSQIKYIGTDKISEIVNDSDSDGGNFTELSDSDTCIAAAAAAVAARKRKSYSQNLTEVERDFAGPFLNAQTQILI